MVNEHIFDVVCVGGAIIDAFLSLSQASVHCRLNKEKCELCVQYGAKIPLEDCQFLLGGNGANVSVGLSRLGLSAGLIAEIGDDEFAIKIHKALEKEKVDKSRIIQTQDAPSTFSMVINFQAERTIFTKHITRSHNFSFDNLSASWLYLTSLGNEWKHVYKKAVEFVKNNNSKLAFNPGSLQIDEGIVEIRELLPYVEILFVNKEEACQIANIKNQKSKIDERIPEIDKLLREIQGMGVKVVVVTDGKEGSYAIDHTGAILFCNTYDGPGIEMTGAGDAYASGVLGATLAGKTISDAMKWGTINATSVISKVGAESGLLSREIIEEEIQKQTELQIEELHK